MLVCPTRFIAVFESLYFGCLDAIPGGFASVPRLVFLSVYCPHKNMDPHIEESNSISSGFQSHILILDRCQGLCNTSTIVLVSHKDMITFHGIHIFTGRYFIFQSRQDHI